MNQYEEQIIRKNMQKIIKGVDSHNNNGGETLIYGATAEREDIVEVMKEFITKTEDGWGKDVTILQ